MSLAKKKLTGQAAAKKLAKLKAATATEKATTRPPHKIKPPHDDVPPPRRVRPCVAETRPPPDDSPPIEDEIKKPIRLLSRLQVMDRVNLCYPNIWAKMREGTFPRSRAVGGRSVWLESEIDEWIAALPLVRLKGDDMATTAEE